MAYMIGVGLSGGKSATLRASAGVAVGVLAYSLIIAAGAGELVSRVPWALTVLRIAGAAYLVWLGIDALRTARRNETFAATDPKDQRWFLRGLIVNLTNPKMVLFFLSFLPQFARDAESTTAQFIALGLLYMIIGYVVDTCVGLFAGTLQTRMSGNPRAAKILNSLAGVVFFALASLVIAELFVG